MGWWPTKISVEEGLSLGYLWENKFCPKGNLGTLIGQIGQTAHRGAKELQKLCEMDSLFVHLFEFFALILLNA